MSSLDLPVLKINRLWVPIEAIAARQAFSDISAGAVSFLKFEDGYPKIFSLEEWVTLTPSEGDDFVVTSKMHQLNPIVIPRVAICVNYGEFRAKEVKCNNDNLLKRYGGKDAWGNPLSRKDASREHVTPQSRGGQDGWENEVPMHRLDNSRRGNRPYEEVGMTAPKILPPPPPMLPINLLVNTRNWPEWAMFHIPNP